MKYNLFSALVINMLLCSVSDKASACGPYDPIIPTPEFFKIEHHKTMGEYDKEENLRLWQALTTDKIPLSDIEEIVYRTPNSELHYYDESAEYNNLFESYLYNTGDSEIMCFLTTAKDIEDQWRSMQSPWYYPRSRDRYALYDETDNFQGNIEYCKNYRGSRLKDRYALQVVRALFASRRLEECIEYFDSVFVSFPDSNLMKRMAQRYVAGCWSRLDNKERADSIFAQAGDIWSLSVDDKVAYMAEHNPNAPQIMEYIRSAATDTLRLTKLLPIARRMIDNKAIRHKGDWAFMLAYFYKEYTGDAALASYYINRALNHSFSTTELRDLAHCYKMKISAYTGNAWNLLSDLKWIESKCNALNPDMNEWIRRTKNIIYVDWVPQLWKKKDYATAILMAAYADYLNLTKMWDTVWDTNRYMPNFHGPHTIASITEIRSSENYFNYYDYSSLSFQMMGSLTSSQLAAVYNQMMASNPLYNHLRKEARSDSDYYNELIGTLALREENYPLAVRYLSKVSDRYQRTTNIYKCGFLSRDPFFNEYPMMWNEDAVNDKWDYEKTMPRNDKKSPVDAKLNFARAMKKYQHQMLKGKTSDERGWARLMYAIGRYNSFERCWALTQYWQGFYTGIFVPEIEYWGDSFASDNYDFLYDYEYSDGHETAYALFESEVEKAMAIIQSDELKAKAEYLFGNLKTIVNKYPDTNAAHFIKTSCDNWRDWM